MAAASTVDHQSRRAERRLSQRQRPAKVTGRARRPDDGPVTFYVDGSVSRQRVAGAGLLTGWGYLATDGRYGCGTYPQVTTKTGRDPDQVAELRAIWYAVGDLLAVEHVTVVTDNANAIATIASWWAGSSAMPAGYTGSTTKAPTLEKLRQAVTAHRDNLTVERVAGRRGGEVVEIGDVLHDGADTLAMLGMRWARDELLTDDVARRAQDIAEGFLADYRRRRW